MWSFYTKVGYILFLNESLPPCVLCVLCAYVLCAYVLCVCYSLIGRRDEVDVEGSVLEEECTYGATTQAEKVGDSYRNLVYQDLM